ncbi:hypothetical protein [Streptomyces solincola]|uniref:hypothetical protein n=1 Tax=Streptomyces solincola TaxID=2100817 RepID=UPI0015E2A278|nr:hypothetical protein [Streptomyces solincola]
MVAFLLVRGTVVSHTHLTGDESPRLHPAVRAFLEALPADRRELAVSERAVLEGCAVTLGVTAPEGTPAPYSSVGCTVRVGHAAAAPAAAELSLRVGAGAVLGRPWEAVRQCVRELTGYASGAAEQPEPRVARSAT